MPSKYMQLVKRLIARQSQGKLDWNATEVEGVFQLSFPDYSLRIYERQSRAGTDIVIALYNEEGTQIDEFTDVSLHQEWEESYLEMSGLYAEARRVALGVDKALDSLLNELRD